MDCAGHNPIPLICTGGIPYGTSGKYGAQAVSQRGTLADGSFTWDPFDATFSIDTPTYIPKCPDGTGGASPPAPTVTVTG
jgi:hypothetical protein